MSFSTVKQQLANAGEKGFFNNTYEISNEFGRIAIVYADNAGEALDIAADSGHMNCQLMSDYDYGEAMENNWFDTFITIGYDSAPYWTENLTVTER